MTKIADSETVFKSQEEDPGFLVARGRFLSKDKDVTLTKEQREMQEKNHRNKLANAIYMAIINHGYAHVRAIGTRAIANAVRSITSATDRCQKKGISLMWDSVVDKGNLGELRQSGHVQDVTAYSFRLKHWEEVNDG